MTLSATLTQVRTFFCSNDKVFTKEDGKSYVKVNDKDVRVIPAHEKVRTTLIALAIITAVVAALGALVYFNVLSVALNSVGTLGQNPAFWLMAGGGATAIVSTILAVFSKGIEAKKAKTEQEEPAQ